MEWSDFADMLPKDTDISANFCPVSSDLSNTVNPVNNDIRYYSKIRYNIILVSTKISGSCFFVLLLLSFSLIFPCYSSGKHTFCVFVRIASARRF